MSSGRYFGIPNLGPRSRRDYNFLEFQNFVFSGFSKSAWFLRNLRSSYPPFLRSTQVGTYFLKVGLATCKGTYLVVFGELSKNYLWYQVRWLISGINRKSFYSNGWPFIQRPENEKRSNFKVYPPDYDDYSNYEIGNGIFSEKVSKKSRSFPLKSANKF